MIADYFYDALVEDFPHTLTTSQQTVAHALARFVTTPQRQAAFILRGYAGTGKTSLVGSLVRTLRRLERDVVLMAPTGRAAKVFSLHAGERAYTIHKVIYRQQTFRGEGTRFSLGFNKLRHALFIVDEASMVAQGGGDSIFGAGRLLDDLIRYVYEGEGCRLLFVGDRAQLPPVGEEESPALSLDMLRGYGLLVGRVDLSEVVRQSADSGVLAGATYLRRLLTEGLDGWPRICGSSSGEVRFLPGTELIEALVSAYADCGTQDTIVVTRSNKRANIYNNGIRARIFDREDVLTRGDIVMAVRNNYYWVAEAQRAEETARAGTDVPPSAIEKAFSFIANGDTAEVVRLRNVHEMHGFHFADATLRFTDYDDIELDCRLLLDTLASEAPALTREESQRLYENVMADYADLPSKAERLKRLRQDPYYNALQVKYAYAVTCHKAQGGQWSRVFVDQGYVTEEMLDNNYLRWLYTAFTRTTDRLYLVNWPKEQQRGAVEEASERGE
jgi:exodeoxyribonuclease-5